MFDIIHHFCLKGAPSSISPFGSGHINDTYLIQTVPGSAPDYVLQRINHQVFKNIPGLMENIAHVTHHIHQQMTKKPGQFPGFQSLFLVPANDGRLFYTDPGGNFWRLYQYIAGSRSYNQVENPPLAYEGGKAFGVFLTLTSELSPQNLIETIPRFHDITWRMEQFKTAIRNDTVHRVKLIEQEIGFVMDRIEEMLCIDQLTKSQQLPLRVTHNDTKFNNILFDRNNKAICIVDLDTVMPGNVLFDFGDAIRTGATKAQEDEEDLSKVSFNMELFEAYTKGFLETAGNRLTRTEIGHLAFSAKFMTFLIGIRFLTDYIQGDTYYKIGYPEHNLQRARVQFALLRSMEIHFSDMKDLVYQVSLFEH